MGAAAAGIAEAAVIARITPASGMSTASRWKAASTTRYSLEDDGPNNYFKSGPAEDRPLPPLPQAAATTPPRPLPSTRSSV